MNLIIIICICLNNLISIVWWAENNLMYLFKLRKVKSDCSRYFNWNPPFKEVSCFSLFQNVLNSDNFLHCLCSINAQVTLKEKSQSIWFIFHVGLNFNNLTRIIFILFIKNALAQEKSRKKKNEITVMFILNFY